MLSEQAFALRGDQGVIPQSALDGAVDTGYIAGIRISGARRIEGTTPGYPVLSWRNENRVYQLTKRPESEIHIRGYLVLTGDRQAIAMVPIRVTKDGQVTDMKGGPITKTHRRLLLTGVDLYVGYQIPHEDFARVEATAPQLTLDR